MTEKQRNDFFYVCSLIEYIARKTKNRRGVIAAALGKVGKEADELLSIFCSFISDKISDFQTDVYHQSC